VPSAEERAKCTPRPFPAQRRVRSHSVTLVGPDEDVLDQVGSIFRNWTDRLAAPFVAGGMSEGAAHRMATVTIAATEGATDLSQAPQTRDPFDDVATTVSDLVRDVR
jgi:hypothetical protein